MEIALCLIVALVLLVLAAPGVRATGRAAEDMPWTCDRPVEPIGFTRPKDEGNLL